MNEEEERYRHLAMEVSALASGAASAITADSIRRTTAARRHSFPHILAVHRVATVSFVVAVVVAAVVVVAAPSPHGSIVAVDTGATPSGWVPVDYGDAQISVPSGWNARYDTSCDVAQAPGSVFVGVARLHSCLGNGDAEAPHVHIGPTSGPLETAPISRKTVNGIVVLEVSHDSLGTSYVVPALGVSLQLVGAAAQRVLATLTYSPRAVVQSAGPAPTAPSSWHWFSFAGIGFAAPSNWPRDVGSSYGPGCVPRLVGFSEEIVSLSTDTRFLLPSAAGCVYVVPPLKATDGVSVNAIAARVVPTPSQLATHCLEIHGLVVCPYTDPAFGILYLRVSGPQLPRTVMVEIGLAGSGSTARTILGSLRPATEPLSPLCSLCLTPAAVSVWSYGGTKGSGSIVDANRTDPRAVIKFLSRHARETVETDLYVLPMSAPVGSTTEDALSSTIRAKAIWDYAYAENGGSLLTATVGGKSGSRSISLSWPLVTNSGTSITAGEYQLVVPIVVSGQPEGFSVADFEISK